MLIISSCETGFIRLPFPITRDLCQTTVINWLNATEKWENHSRAYSNRRTSNAM